MIYGKLLSMCAAVALTAGGLLVMAPSASGREEPVVVEGPSDRLPTTRVSYADLNLATMAGEKTLNHRVAGAVSTVCEEASLASDIYAEPACRRFAWTGARPQIAQAVQRAHDIALTGSSTIAATAITIAVPR